ncbi:hypothetical protein HMPREF1983_00905 [Gemella bergeri ATCC 700627]|uniref:Purine nucleoside phosphorylase n=1 Tax=Gemella bergeri ATCC 700627 TaxID=1321820 RepID=U2QNJ5_9BACL|nr:peptidoglycan editing factor PgeF [Gemella bergeri]ERK58071.1 hypothetical protein HMPREF1983_00905 [Gemella bergeri ATCC 700627]
MQENNNAFIFNDDNINIIFTKRQIDSKNIDDMKKISAEYNFDFENLAFNTQVHGASVRKIESKDDLKNNGLEADGLITNLIKIPLLIFTADCVPLVFYDKIRNVVALAHAGWRGTYSNISQEIICAMVQDYNCDKKDIKVIIGPSISKENYEVSKELVDKFSVLNVADYYVEKNGKYYLDLWQINKELLVKSGVLEKNIIFSNLCTVKNNDKFFSYRKDEETLKRIGTLIQID